MRFTLPDGVNNSIEVYGLATLCMEKKLLDDIDIDPIINDFTSPNVRIIF